MHGEDCFHLQMEKDHPGINWRAPIVISGAAIPAGWSRLGCRYCIAGYGISGKEIGTCRFVFDTPEQFGQHMAGKHPLDKGDKSVN